MADRAPRPSSFERLLSLSAGSVGTWALVVLGLALATALRVAMDSVSAAIAPFIFYFPVILLAALAGGFAVGATATAGAVLLSWFMFLPPRMSFGITPAFAVSLAGFSGVGLLLAGLGARLKQSENMLLALNADLEERVKERTAALEQEALRREEAEKRVRQSQRLESVGQLAGGVAHDFNNLLTVVIGSLNLVRRGLESDAPAPDRDRVRRLVDAALEAGRRGAALNKRLLAFARLQPLQPVVIDANALIAGTSEVIRRSLGEQIAIETVLAGGLWPTRADPTELEAAVLNLAVNARDAMPDGGKLTIETANVRLDDAYAGMHADVVPGQYVMVAVSDTGKGMDAATMARAFEPFFTTKGIGSGTGLGLSQVYGFVKQSAGNVKIYSESGQGTAVKIYLPRLMPDQARDMAVQEPLRAPSAEATLARPGETVLVVEDDAAVRSFTVSALQGHGYQVLEANDGPSALALLEAGAKVSLLFTDVGLPNGMTGAQLAKAAAAVRPEIKILYASGYTPNAIVHGGVLDDGVLLLPKPFTAEDLALKVRQALDTPQLEKGAKGTA